MGLRLIDRLYVSMKDLVLMGVELDELKWVNSEIISHIYILSRQFHACLLAVVSNEIRPETLI